MPHAIHQHMSSQIWGPTWHRPDKTMQAQSPIVELLNTCCCPGKVRILHANQGSLYPHTRHGECLCAVPTQRRSPISTRPGDHQPYLHLKTLAGVPVDDHQPTVGVEEFIGVRLSRCEAPAVSSVSQVTGDSTVITTPCPDARHLRAVGAL